MFFTNLKPNESVKIGDVEFTVLEKSGTAARVGVKAPSDMKIELIRSEPDKPKNFKR